MNKVTELLTITLNDLSDAQDWLKRSYEICHEIKPGELSKQDYDHFEALSSRFARTVDILINKTFRTIDTVELENTGTLIDVVNRAHKRNLFKSVENIRRLKDLRNAITHEYTSEELPVLFFAILKSTTEVLDIIDNTQNYCQKLVK